MNIASRLYLPILLLSSTLALSGNFIHAAAQDSPAPPIAYPQIVRLSLVQGDVRISRGKQAERTTGATWERASANLPLEEGFSLVTGQGRAEIELEDASTLYLAENSALVFNILSSTDGAPRTAITLLTGTISLNVKTIVAGEWFLLSTPTNAVSLRYPQKAYLRVNSYLDATALTPQDSSASLNLTNGGAVQAQKGQTFTSHNGMALVLDTSAPSNFAEWDKWVADRISVRSDSLSAVMKDAGLSSPLPGLADMNAQGTFFACAPYGTCWEPSHGWTHQAKMNGQPEYQQSATAPSAPQQPAPQAPPQAQQVGYGASSPPYWEDEDPFPCSPDRLRYLLQDDPTTGFSQVIGSEIVDDDYYPYDWAVCNAGSWLYRQHRYVWVVGKRHHHPPLHWVKSGRTTGYVPRHPHDVEGKPPLNLKHGIFVPNNKGKSVEQVAFDPKSSLKILQEPPKDFRSPYFPPLARTEAPHLEAHLAKDTFSGNKQPHGMSPGAIITFDHKSQAFMLARQVTQGGRSTTISEPFGGRTNGARSDGDSGRGGSSFGGSRGSGATGSSARSGGSSGSSSRGSSSGSSSGGGGGGGGSHGSSGGGGGGGGASSGSSGGGGGGGHK